MIAKTAAPRSSVVHMSDLTGAPYTACGREIRETWAGEMNEEPSGPITCTRCLPIATAEEARQAAEMAANALYPVGARVGILVGVQSVNGPHVVRYGTVTRHVRDWNNAPDYVVTDDQGETLVYPAFLLRAAARCVCTDADGFGHTCNAFPAGTAVGDAGTFHGTDFSTGAPAALSILSTEEHMRREAMRRHPAGKARPVKLSDNYPSNVPVPSPVRDPFPGIAEDDGRTGIVKSGGSLFFRLF